MNDMRKATALLLFSLVAPVASAKGFDDKSSLGTTDLALCTAAAMKSGQGFDLYNDWAKALDARYRRMYPQKSVAEVDAYTAERVVDKRKNLERRGIGTTPAYRKFYDENCAPFKP